MQKAIVVLTIGAKEIEVKNKELVSVYNQYLNNDFKKYSVSSFEDFRKFTQSDLKKILFLFEEILTRNCIDSNGEITEAGKEIDDIIGEVSSFLSAGDD